jgi:hypothetical protein
MKKFCFIQLAFSLFSFMGARDYVKLFQVMKLYAWVLTSLRSTSTIKKSRGSIGKRQG